ncbi:hypothetical protein ACFOWA_19490 [Pedobacter lithocola]|uniref:Uncharacterized protein n=1 Tax=Pedobacter lithocola TaxID=1908239 RepID=A0ABV8PFG7_9SPHI
MVKSKKTTRKKLGFINQMISLLLLCAIFSITTIQAFHYHKAISEKNISRTTSYDIHVENCAICEFLLHQKSNEYLPSNQISLAYFLPEPTTIDGTIHSAIYPKAIAAFTNKGPPTTA